MRPRLRILVLPLAAVIILSLCVWRIVTPRQRTSIASADMTQRRPAPAFQLYNQDSELVQLQSYLNRHRIVLVFFDGQRGPEQDPVLSQLREFYQALKNEGFIVLGVSTALPQQIRQSSQNPFPFDLLSDVAATAPESAHRRWGRLIEPEAPGQPAGTRPAVFLIDRSGLVPWQDGQPRSVDHPEQLVSQLLAGG